MSRDSEDSRGGADAKILANLRRRSASTSAAFAEKQPERELDAPRTPKAREPRPASEDRVAALRRLASGNGSNEPTSALSELSSTLRNLREELNDDSLVGYDASAEISADASLELVESELESRERASVAKETSGEAEPDAPQAPPSEENP